MGSFTSKAFTDLMMEEEEEEIPHTPTTEKRLLDFDPRSPTVGIMRTPIQVEKTPERLDDPRSPTVGILRTPIVSSSDDQDQQVRGGKVAGRRRSLSEGSPVKLDPLSMQEALASIPPLDLDIDDDICRDDEIQLIKRSNSEPELANKHSVLQDYKSEASNVPAKAVHKRKPKTALFQGNTNITESPKASQRSPLRVISDGRSPLGTKRNVDMNSPRHIVQRKQVKKLGMLQSNNTSMVKSAGNSPCRFEARSSEDKENLSL